MISVSLLENGLPRGKGPPEENRNDITILIRHFDVVYAGSPSPVPFTGSSQQCVTLPGRPDEFNRRAGRERHAVVGIAGESKRGICQRKNITAVTNAMPVDHVAENFKACCGAARCSDFNLNAKILRGAITDPHLFVALLCNFEVIHNVIRIN